jgi:hypothetical protein
VVRRITALVRPGQWVLVLDLSTTGALVAALRPLRPGAAVYVHFEADGEKAAFRANVVRCTVAALDAERMVYHAALAFDQPSEWVRERQGHHVSGFLGSTSAGSTNAVNPIPDNLPRRVAHGTEDAKWFEIPRST